MATKKLSQGTIRTILRNSEQERRIDPPDPQRWRLIEDLFGAALEVAPEERAVFLDQACDDEPTRRAVQRLLDADGEADGFLDVDGEDQGSRKIGPYHLVEFLGKGGMGTVYLAEQTEPVRRQVALKLISSSFRSHEATVRFEVERRAMARLQHPNIAQMFEANSTDDGQAYFVMEYVPGEVVTEYCDACELGLEDRLRIFSEICAGVQHAHQKGLLHRDLKPSNILVTEIEGRPTPKIIDFGIAKAIDEPLTEETLLTGSRVIGTPGYLSPEAIEHGGQEVDTRTDVYALGVLLHELLVGAQPFATAGMSLLQALRWITDEDPPGPNTRWQEIDAETQLIVARRRSLDTRGLAKSLRGDLDSIVLKAIARDRRERYDSVAQLAADVRRYLRDEPVEASPPSTLYQMGKFLRRHRSASVASGIVLLSLVLGTVGTSIGLVRAQRAEREAVRETETTQEVVDFLMNMFEVSDPGVAKGGQVTAREILDQGAERIEAELAGEPLIRARLMGTIGEVYRKLGLYPAARALLEKAIEIAGEEPGAIDQEVATNLGRLAKILAAQGAYQEAEVLFLRALDLEEKALGDDHPAVALSLTRLGALHYEQGRFEEAESAFRRVLLIQEKALGPDHPDVARSLGNLAGLQTRLGRYDAASKLYPRILEIQEQALGADSPEVATSLNNLAILLKQQNRLDEAESAYGRALGIWERILGSGHPDIALSLNNLANVHLAQGRHADAEPLLRRALGIWEQALGPEHPYVATCLGNLARSAISDGRFSEAEKLYERAWNIQQKALEPDHPDVLEMAEQIADFRRIREENDG